jgi:hypothetical protein
MVTGIGPGRVADRRVLLAFAIRWPAVGLAPGTRRSLQEHRRHQQTRRSQSECDFAWSVGARGAASPQEQYRKCFEAIRSSAIMPMRRDQRSLIIIFLPEVIECGSFFRAERHTLFGYNQREYGDVR